VAQDWDFNTCTWNISPSLSDISGLKNLENIVLTEIVDVPNWLEKKFISSLILLGK